VSVFSAAAYCSCGGVIISVFCAREHFGVVVWTHNVLYSFVLHSLVYES
jgi:hypothetical protein